MPETLTPTTRRSWIGRLGAWALGVLIVVALVVLVVHVMIPPVSPRQSVPLGHFGGSCGLCHFVSEGVDVVPVQ